MTQKQVGVRKIPTSDKVREATQVEGGVLYRKASEDGLGCFKKNGRRTGFQALGTTCQASPQNNYSNELTVVFPNKEGRFLQTMGYY